MTSDFLKLESNCIKTKRERCASCVCSDVPHDDFEIVQKGSFAANGSAMPIQVIRDVNNVGQFVPPYCCKKAREA